jgi:hypothetical protein
LSLKPIKITLCVSWHIPCFIPNVFNSITKQEEAS